MNGELLALSNLDGNPPRQKIRSQHSAHPFEHRHWLQNKNVSFLSNWGPQGIIQAICHFQCKPMVGNLFSRNPKCAIGRWFILQLWIAELNYYMLLPFSGGYILILWVYVLSATLLIFIAWLTIIPTTYLSNCPDAARCCVSWLIKSMNSDTCASGFQNGCMNLMENQ
jgi:hypothetical protein